MAVEIGPVHPTPIDKLTHAVREAGGWAWRHLVPVSLSTTVAALGIGGYLFLTHNRVPQNTVADNAPITDRLNPPDRIPNVGIVINPPVDSTPPSTSTPVEQPRISPVEEAIKAGKIEIKGPEDVEKYFTFVSADEARQMLAEAKARGEFKFLLPQYDVTGINQLTIENRRLIGNADVVYLVMRGFNAGTTFYSNVDGQGSASSPSEQLKRFISINIDNGEVFGNISTPAGPDYKTLPTGGQNWPLQSVYNVKDGKNPVAMGNPLFVLPTEDFLREGISVAAGGGTWEDRMGDWQIKYLIRVGNNPASYDYTLATLANMLRHPQNGKIIMLDSSRALQGK